MPTRSKGTLMWVAQTEPRLLEAFPITATIDVMDRQVEITLDFSNVPHPQLNLPKKLISRDPAVIAFHQRIHDAIKSRYAEVERALTEREEAA